MGIVMWEGVFCTNLAILFGKNIRDCLIFYSFASLTEKESYLPSAWVCLFFLLVLLFQLLIICGWYFGSHLWSRGLEKCSQYSFSGWFLWKSLVFARVWCQYSQIFPYAVILCGILIVHSNSGASETLSIKRQAQKQAIISNDLSLQNQIKISCPLCVGVTPNLISFSLNLRYY